jgi:glycosyltransferase involved in cell wall biosynthesis
MKIAVLNVQAPFIRGGAEYLADSLTDKLTEAGHEVEQVRIPFKWYPATTISEHMMSCRLLDLRAGQPDLVIALKFPAYLAPFTNKKVWLLHQFRQVYELWGTPFQDMPDGPEEQRLRAMIVAADNRSLREARAVYTNSRIVADRLRRFNQIEADGVLYPPLRHPELFICGEPGDYFFYPSRLNPMKRQALAIEAMQRVKSRFRLILAGLPDQSGYEQELAALAQRLGAQDRVQFLGWVSEEEKSRLMAHAVAALYLPHDEDSYGYVTLEAFQSSKPVITCMDSGGTDELVEPGRNGLIVEPTPEALAAAMERLWARQARTREMGRAARETLRERGIEWGHIIERLVA